VELFSPEQGWTGLQPRFALIAGGGGGDHKRPPGRPSLALNGQPLNFPRIPSRRDGSDTASSRSGPAKDWIAWGGGMGVRTTDQVIAFEPVVIDSAAGDLAFEAESPLRVELFDDRVLSFDINNLQQSFDFEFPAANFPIPEYWTPDGARLNALDDRLRGAQSGGPERLFNPDTDVLQSLVPRHGDYRLIAREPKTSLSRIRHTARVEWLTA